MDCEATTAGPSTEPTTDPNPMTTGSNNPTETGPTPTEAPWKCAQCFGVNGLCLDESDNGHSSTCYGSSGKCFYMTQSMITHVTLF